MQNLLRLSSKKTNCNLLLICLGAVATLQGCAHHREQQLRQRARQFSEHVAIGDRSKIMQFVVPSQRAELDVQQLVDRSNVDHLPPDIANENRMDWSALLKLGLNDVAAVEKTDGQGWRFSEDPTQYYSQASPRQAMRSWVLSTLHQRWDILLELAPQRYRAAMNIEDLKNQWTRGKDANALRAIRDRVAENLDVWIDEDAHQARAELGGGIKIIFEREGERWVIASF